MGSNSFLLYIFLWSWAGLLRVYLCFLTCEFRNKIDVLLNCEESWVLKNWCFWTVVLEKTLESPLDCKEIQPVHYKGDIKEISPGCSLEEMMLKLKLQYFGHLMCRVDSLETLWCCVGLGAGGKGNDRGWDGWMASPSRRTLVWVNSGS